MQEDWKQQRWGNSVQYEVPAKEQNETSQHCAHLAGLDNDDPRVLVILLLLLLFRVNAL